MARPLRLEHENAIWHLTARGNEQRDIFRDDIDRERFLAMLAETIIRFGWKLFSWVLMSNHYHLLVQTPQPNVSRGMHWLNGRYAQWFNRRHGRHGHLFQGRFHGALVEKEGYLLTVARYVVLNPVRAKMVETAADWRWSSYRQTAGLETPAPWLDVEDLLEYFGGANKRGCDEYVQFIAGGIEQPSPWKDLVGQIYLGSPEWIREVGDRIASAPRSAEHPREQLRSGRPEMSDIVAVVAEAIDSTVGQVPSPIRRTSAAKSVAAFIAFEDGLYRQSEIGAALGIRGRSTVSSAVRRCRDALRTNNPLHQLVDACRHRMPRAALTFALPPPDRTGFHDEHQWFRPRHVGS
jgi:REP element-mobilizing transposase RayT